MAARKSSTASEGANVAAPAKANATVVDPAAAATAATTTSPVKTPTSEPNAADHVAEAAAAKVKAADEETAKVAAEGRLPENAAITSPAPATEMEGASGAFIEPEIKVAIPVDHPAVDNNPRAGTSAVQNGADFNDPYGHTPNDPDFAGEGIDRSVYGKVEADKK